MLANSFRIQSFKISFLIFIHLFFCCIARVAAQQRSYGKYELSSFCHLGLCKAFIDKEVPQVTESRKAQTLFKRYAVQHRAYVSTLVLTNTFVEDSVVEPYLQSILNELVAANKDIVAQKPRLLLGRSMSSNAISIGDNTICMFAGMPMEAQSREQLAFYMAHEIAHDILNHTENEMKIAAEFNTTDSFKTKIQEILRRKYYMNTNFTNLLLQHKMDVKAHSRFCEAEADSLGYILFKRTKMLFNADFFLQLDSMNRRCEKPLAADIHRYFPQFPERQKTAKASKPSGLSARRSQPAAHVEEKDDDTTSTHPATKERFAKFENLSDPQFRPTPIPQKVRDAATVMGIEYAAKTSDILNMFYKMFQANEERIVIKDTAFLITFGLYSILLHAQNLRLQKMLPESQPGRSSAQFNELRNMLKDVPDTALSRYCMQLYQQNQPVFSEEQKALLQVMQTVADKSVLFDKQRSLLDDFNKKFPDGIYTEFL